MPPCASTKRPGARALGPGESAALVAEELRLEQRLGDGRAVDGDERPALRACDRRCARRAQSSFPLPVSPVMMRLVSLRAARAMVTMARTSGGDSCRRGRPRPSRAATSGASAVSTSTRRACLAAWPRGLDGAQRALERDPQLLRGCGRGGAARSDAEGGARRASRWGRARWRARRAPRARCRAATPLTRERVGAEPAKEGGLGAARGARGERHGLGGERAVGALGRLRRDLDRDALGLVGAAARQQRLGTELREREPRRRSRAPAARDPRAARCSATCGRSPSASASVACRASRCARFHAGASGRDGVSVEQVARQVERAELHVHGNAGREQRPGTASCASCASSAARSHARIASW